MYKDIVVDVEDPFVVAPEGGVGKVDRGAAAVGRAAVGVAAPYDDALLGPLRQTLSVSEEEGFGVAEPALAEHLDEAVALLRRHYREHDVVWQRRGRRRAADAFGMHARRCWRW